MPLSVLSLNLWHVSPPYERRAARIRDWIERLRPDVIGFQEAVRSEDWCQVTELLSGLGYHVTFGALAPFWENPSSWFGNAIASRWPTERHGLIDLPMGPSRHRRGALWAEIRAPFGRLVFATVHLDHLCAQSRLIQVETLLANLWRSAKPLWFPPVLVGDFNAAPDTPEIQLALTGAGRHRPLIDSWHAAGSGPGITWSADNGYAKVREPPGRRIDYVFVGEHEQGLGTPESCELVCDDRVQGVWASDHFGVLARIAIEPRADLTGAVTGA